MLLCQMARFYVGKYTAPIHITSSSFKNTNYKDAIKPHRNGQNSGLPMYNSSRYIFIWLNNFTSQPQE